MIDHVAARRLAATAIDAPLEPFEATDLDAHLASCPACRSVSEAFARDAAALTHFDLGPVPFAVRADVAIAAERNGRGNPVGRWVGLVAVGALLVLALGSGAFSTVGGRGSAESDAANVPANPIHWETGAIDLQASDFWIQTATGRVPASGSRPTIKAAPDGGSWTLEVVWAGPGQPVILRIILVDIDGGWRVKGVQVSDGATGALRDAQGPFVGASLGDGRVGNVDLDITDATRARVTIVGHLHFSDLALNVAPAPAVGPTFGVPPPPVGKPLDPIAALRCSGLLQRTPKEVAETLIGLGYVATWTIQRTDPNGEVTATPATEVPDGTIIAEPTLGADGVLQFVVAPPGDPAAIPLGVPADCPTTDTNVTPATPVPGNAAG